MKKNLQGKVALITGASRGIGRAIALRLAREGADVVFSYSASAAQAEELTREILALGVRALAIQADQADAQAVQAMVRQAHGHFGRLDILVNSAGVFVTGTVGEGDSQALQRQLDINVRGVAATVHAAAPLLSDGGRIVSIGTTGAVHVPFAGVADYVATKAAVGAYTRGWSRDLGPRNITVNLIQPGAINTDMNPQDGPFSETLKSLASLGRYGQPEDIAAAVAFLAGPEAGYITGATLNVDGGQSA